ncbi:MAG TPA: sigma-70 family RNA polymerase sigma factor [Pirellulales bacterium]|nr:sigma-70 family RNA polymerase sigma factor [Pirellulales bacterium]
MTDGELVRQTLAGRTSAYGELVRRWSARVLAVCHSKVRFAHAAEDLAQEAMLRALRSLSTLSEPEKFGPWLRGIAVRVCFDWLKNKQTSQVPFTALGDDCDPAEMLAARETSRYADEHKETLARLVTEVEALPEPYREVLMLYYYDDVTYAELASLLGVSAATINARLTKARGLLRERMASATEVRHGS